MSFGGDLERENFLFGKVLFDPLCIKKTGKERKKLIKLES